MGQQEAILQVQLLQTPVAVVAVEVTYLEALKAPEVPVDQA
jgi:hypothetical protein